MFLYQRRYKKYCTIARRPGSGRPTKITNFVLQLVNQQMRINDETTATQLYDILLRHGISISLSTVLRSRQQLGWTFHGSAYCQLIREANKAKRLEWARQHTGDDFANVIWTDKASVQLETHRKRCYRKAGECPKPKPRPKHPIKVHVWAGISMEGVTDICIFTGIMNAEFYISILQQCLLPFLQRKFTDKEHRFMQDNTCHEKLKPSLRKMNSHLIPLHACHTIQPNNNTFSIICNWVSGDRECRKKDRLTTTLHTYKIINKATPHTASS